MELIQEILAHLSMHVRPYLSHVGMMVVATLLVLYGSSINRAVRRQVGHYNFFFRTLVFVLLCAFGYGLLLTWLTPLLVAQLRAIPNQYLGLVVVAIVIGLGMLVERKRDA
ncbi:MAG: DUF3392 domain-containing protein [Idiomarina sp.]|nr:DUF3392 domain-containing protein [Idiomarina sp.]